MTDLPDNSKAAKAKVATPKKTVEAVVEAGEATTKKKGLGRKFKETFVQGDSKSVWSYVFVDVMLPSVKDTFENMVGEFTHRMLFGNSARPMTRNMAGMATSALGRQVYNSAFSSPFATNRTVTQTGAPVGPQISRQARALHQFDDVVLPTRGHAERVVAGLVGLLQQYNEVTVRDFYMLCSITPTFADESFGWTDLTGTDIQRLRGGSGFVIVLPPAIQLN